QQRFGIDLERQAPEFLAAEKARDRLAREPPRRKRRNGAGFIGREHAARLGRERRVVEPKRMADESARSRRGAVTTAATKPERQPPSRRADRAAGKRPPRHDGAPSAASNSA